MITYWYHAESESYFLAKDDAEAQKACDAGCDQISSARYLFMTGQKPERILVCGGRDYKNQQHVYYALNECYIKNWFADEFCIIQGEATGADAFAKAWARENGICCVGVEANWDYFRKQGFPKKAGYIRNGWMRKFCQPELVIAFPGGAGTAGMVTLAKAAKIPVYEVGDAR